jgi:hypothetical protein
MCADKKGNSRYKSQAPETGEVEAAIILPDERKLLFKIALFKHKFSELIVAQRIQLNGQYAA